MAISYQVQRITTIGGQTITSNETGTVPTELILEVQVAHGSTNQAITNFAFPKAKVVALHMASLAADGVSTPPNLTLKINSSSAPDDTFLVKPSGTHWTASDPLKGNSTTPAPPFTNDVASAFVTNPSGSVDAVLYVWVALNQ